MTAFRFAECVLASIPFAFPTQSRTISRFSGQINNGKIEITVRISVHTSSNRDVGRAKTESILLKLLYKFQSTGKLRMKVHNTEPQAGFTSGANCD